MTTEWPSLEDKFRRAIILRLQTITVANGFQSEIESANVIGESRSTTWMQDHVPSIQVILGDEGVIEDHIGRVIKTIDVHLAAVTKSVANPQLAQEKLIADIKTALYTSNRLEDPDNPGTNLPNRTIGIEVERFIGDPALGVAGAELTVQLEYPEDVQLP